MCERFFFRRGANWQLRIKTDEEYAKVVKNCVAKWQIAPYILNETIDEDFSKVGVMCPRPANTEHQFTHWANVYTYVYARIPGRR